MRSLSAIASWGIGGMIAASILLATAPAAPPPDLYRDRPGTLYIHGATATAEGLELWDYSEPYTRQLRANRCGVLQVKPTPTRPDLGQSLIVQSGEPIELNRLPQLPSAPRCRGNQLQPGQNQHFRVGERLYLVGFVPGVRYALRFPDVPRRRRLHRNACGFYRLENPPQQFGVAGQDYTLGELVIAEPQLCRGGVTYTPETWD